MAWISTKTTEPPVGKSVLVAIEFAYAGDWRMKVGAFNPESINSTGGWIIAGASWTPSHWMPLPPPPETK